MIHTRRLEPTAPQVDVDALAQLLLAHEPEALELQLLTLCAAASNPWTIAAASFFSSVVSGACRTSVHICSGAKI
ncbi:hypothetical protein PR202_ga12187 [Eleusine coracana subsp. coracana]|uniref:Uncharacterized protein n=1 Tax=Eleusine coracana subsp. coracana TaxID=191504 RepID=A0AAV5CBF7_ELECO|nr:hypothetical protein PR202_ga12187 [Eleusine coracana subsp. coracana]